VHLAQQNQIVQRLANFAPEVRASQASVPVGTNNTFTFLVVNNGPDPATGVQLIVPLPAGMNFFSASGGITPVSGTLAFSVGFLAAGFSFRDSLFLACPQSATGAGLSSLPSSPARMAD
jgi:uncharacterized repeat protein (TIGR01451 family)